MARNRSLQAEKQLILLPVLALFVEDWHTEGMVQNDFRQYIIRRC